MTWSPTQLCDALLGAAGLGDLGSNFGTTAPEWSSANGAAFLVETGRRVRAAGFEIENVARTADRQSTRRSDHGEPKPRPCLSEALGAPVSVSATTTDGLGLTGRGEGVAAIATALLTRQSVT